MTTTPGGLGPTAQSALTAATVRARATPVSPSGYARARPATSFRALLLGAGPQVGASKSGRFPRDAGPPIPATQARAPHAGRGRDAVDPDAGGRSSLVRREKEGTGNSKEDQLDPAARHAAQLAPPLGTPVLSPLSSPTLGHTAPEVRARASLEELLPALVKKIAWAGDGRRGSVRMELGAGTLAGGTVIVHADEGRVRVELATPPGADPEEWRRRITERLSARGLTLDRVEVT